MSRRRHDEVQVRCVSAVGVLQQEPSEFVWQGRLHSVTEVLGQWQQRHPWWRLEGTPAAGGLEEEVWRVEARAGRCGTSGVFDLVASPADGGWGTSWRLVRVQD